MLLHDSLCKEINDTILSREKIGTEKIWAPNLSQILSKLDTINEVEVIVIQALTRDATNMEFQEIVTMIDNVVKKACTKAKKVVISTIVDRDDDETVKMKVELINASIKFNYLRNPKVFICDNRNLSDEKYRIQDGIHLTPRGTSLLAGNLKATIAKALEITIEKKEKRSFERRMNRRNDFYRKFNTRDSDNNGSFR